MSIESLTYAELGERLGASAEAAGSLARRLRLPRRPGNDGKVRITVDFDEISTSRCLLACPAISSPTAGT